jgi:FMN phosphatase YigB (HAD superfamily)
VVIGEGGSLFFTQERWCVMEALMDDSVAVFFDIGETLATGIVQSGHLARLEPYPFVPEVLQRLRSSGGEASVAIGLISNTGDESAERLAAVLADAGLLDLLDANLCLFSSVEGMDKSQPAFFSLAVNRAGVPAPHCVYVGEDAHERTVAASAGLRVSPHPLHALHLVETEFHRP